jgi:hypothetical protein
MAHDAVIPEINLDTPGSLSPNEEVTHVQSEPPLMYEDPDISGDNRPALQHAITAPASVQTPSSHAEAALDKSSDDVSPAGKG